MMTASPLAALRQTFAGLNLDGFVVPRTDEYQGEYVAPSSERLAWVTGFTGSAGTAVILADQAWLFTDGRYTIQAKQEVGIQPIDVLLTSDKPMHETLAERLPKGTRLGFDPWLHTPDQVGHLQRACERAEATLIALDHNPVDRIWRKRPPPPSAPVVLHPVEFAGQDWNDKVTLIAALMKTDAVVFSDPSSVAWLLNIRGGDVPFTPLPLGRAILYADGPRIDVFMDQNKVSDQLQGAFAGRVVFHAPDQLTVSVGALSGRTVQVDYGQVPQALISALEQAGAKLVKGTDPCVAPRAEKNPVELAGCRSAHRRDGAAMVKFLAWLADHSDGADELSVTDTVYDFRAQGEHFKDLSFPTIAGFGSNGAIVHYRSTPTTNLRLCQGGLLLLDSGAQYLDGTTDITRTIAIGTCGEEEKRRFTQVLKGHIAVARAVFPVGTTGSQLDVLARLALWSDGVDFDHGTGHGVGSYLSVHEGPQRISKTGNTVALKAGHILSNEPGYYKAGHYGIRLENLLVVVEIPKPEGGEKALLGFEPLTLVPFDRSMIIPELMSKAETDWLDQYHARVLAEIGPSLAGQDRDWLVRATRPICA
jgi:Xaa-Pro aminopeptidase